MSQSNWTALYKWLFAVFPPAIAQESYDEQIAEARALGLELPA